MRCEPQVDEARMIVYATVVGGPPSRRCPIENRDPFSQPLYACTSFSIPSFFLCPFTSLASALVEPLRGVLTVLSLASARQSLAAPRGF